MYANQINWFETPRGIWEGVRGEKFKNVGKIPNSCTKFGTRMLIHLGMDVGFTTRDIKGHCRGLGDHKFKNVGKMPNRWTDRDQICHTYADSSGSGCRLKKNNHSRHQGAL